jgi:hypothetical protein
MSAVTNGTDTVEEATLQAIETWLDGLEEI